MNYYRRETTIGAARDTVEQAAYLTAGFTPLIDAAQTVPGTVYTIGGPDNRVDPRAWDNATGLRATRRAEWCRTCGQWLQTPGGCLCAHRRAQPAPVTTRPSRARRGVAVDIVCGPRYKRYFVAYGAVGVATSPDAYLAYHQAGWARAGHGTILGVIRDAAGEDLIYTNSGPDRPCTREEFLRIARGRAQVAAPDSR